MSFPIEKQLESNWCWAAVSSTTDHFFNSKSVVDQCTIADKVMPDDRDCCLESDRCNEPMKLQEVLQSVGRLANMFDGWLTFLEIRSEIDDDRPVAVRIAWFGGGAHFVLICGYKVLQSGMRKLRIADPLYGDIVSGTYFGIWEIDYDLFPEFYQDGGNWTHTFFVKPKPGDTP